jgi:hypothetical protein
MNRKVTGLLLCLVAVFAVSAVVAALASATTMELPKWTGTDTTFTGSSGKGSLEIEGAAAIACTADSATGAVAASRNEGTGTITFTGCKESSAPNGNECRSLGGTLGTISSTGTWNLVLRTISGTDHHYFDFVLPSQGLHIECPLAPVELFLITGSALGSLVQAGANNFTIKVSSVSGKQEISEYENNSGTLVKDSLSVTEEGGSKAKSAAENDEGLLEFPLATSIEK